MEGWERAAPRGEPVVLAGDFQLLELAFTPDGSGLMTYSYNNTVRFWRVDPTLLLQNACGFVSRNLSWDEWQRFMQPAGTNNAYRRTCEDLPVHSSFLNTVTSLATEGRRGEAMEQIALINSLEQRRIAEPEHFYEWARAAALRERSLFQIRLGELDAALADIAEARRLDPDTALQAWELMSLCALGVSEGRPAEVADACDRAVVDQPLDAEAYDLRAAARALQGDTAGAMADLESYLDLTAHETWR
jgi:hypothetical protein